MFKKIIDFIDGFLNRTAMYRLVLYYLLFLFAVSLIFGFFVILPYRPTALLFSGVVVMAVCWLTNKVFASVFKVQANIESVFITALILVLIITPPQSFNYFSNFALLFWASIWAIASKYIFAVNKKHIFNPAAFGVALTAFTINQSASWWVGGNLALLPFVLLGGLLIVRKLQRGNLIYAFFVAAFISVMGLASVSTNPFSAVGQALLHSPILFFAFVMLTEPLTTPPTKFRQIIYGGLTGLLFGPNVHFGSVYSTPELALLAGNVFSYILSPKNKYVLRFVRKIQTAPDAYDFLFVSDKTMQFKPGQYLEWTLGHKRSDSRGNRRYFTLASSPTEEFVRLGVKFYPAASSFKKALATLEHDQEVMAGQLAGDFVLPGKKDKKLVFIAGGIGITPYRSMIKYLLDKNEKRDIVLLYSNRTAQDVIYKDVFDTAHDKFGLKTVYTLTEEAMIPPTWQGKRGFITPTMMRQEVPDYDDRMFYLSGPRSMVVYFEEVLKDMGIKTSNIKTDFFPGFV